MRAVAEYCQILSTRTGKAITIIACGEQWAEVREDENAFRPALEDYLGAGAILSYVEQAMSPDASVCRAAFRGMAGFVEELIWECLSGKELRHKGLEEDVRFSSRLDAYTVVPVLRDGAFQSKDR